MTIGIDISNLSSKKTGTGRYIECLLKELNSLNHKIKEVPTEKYEFIRNKKLPRLYYKYFNMRRELLREETDCAIFPNYFIAPGYNKPSAIVIHDLSFITHKNFYSKTFVNYYKYELKRTLVANPLVITLSNHTKNEIINHLGLDENNIYIVQGYSNFRNINFNHNKEGDYFLYVGHIEPRKNLTFLVENFLKWKRINNSNIKLKLVGELWIKNIETKELLVKYRNNDSIEFLGYVQENELKELYKNALAFVHTSFVEGFCFPVLEAREFNLPVLCSENTAAEEISKPNSISINPKDPNNLINGFNKLLYLAKKENQYNYNIPFSPELMRKQLEPVIEKLESKIKKKFFLKYYKATNPENAVLKTLIYSSLFNSGIKISELKKNIFEIKISENELNLVLNTLISEKKIFINNDIVFINKESNNFYKKSERKISESNLRIILSLMKNLPFISMVAFSGGSANYGLRNHNDVDVFIITKPNTVFIVYLMIHIFSLIFRLRDTLCANYLIDENSILIEDQDLYIAHQMISLKPLVNVNYINYFFTINKWIKNYFPNFEFAEVTKPLTSKLYFIFKPVNKIIKNFYRIFYRTKLADNDKSSVILKDGIIKLHTKNHRIKILKEFEKVCRTYYLNSFAKTKEISEKFLEKAR